MSDKKISENPFCALFPSTVEAESFSKSSSLNADKKFNGQPPVDKAKIEISNLIEEVFRITLDPDLPPSQFLYLEDLSAALKGQKHIELGCLNQALFERLMLDNPEACAALSSDLVEAELYEKRVLFYLYQSFHRLCKIPSVEAPQVHVDAIKAEIVGQSCTFLCHPDVFPPDNAEEQLIELLRTYHTESGHSEVLIQFLVSVAERIVTQEKNGEDDVTLLNALAPSLEKLRECVLKLSLVNTDLFRHLDILHFFTQSHWLSEALLDFSTPTNSGNGRAYQQSLLGAFLGMSCLPHNVNEPYPFFDNPAQLTPQQHSITETSLWVPLSSLASEFHKIFHIILKQSPAAKHKLLSWIGKCLRANSARSKIWNSQLQGFPDSDQASDGFLLNLESVLLQLCKPFTETPSQKLLKIDPSYCRVQTDPGSAFESTIHLFGLAKETFLVTPDDEDVAPNGKSGYNFMTEMFFLTHFALRLGFKVVHEQLVKLSQELGRIQRLYEESRIQGGEASDVVQSIKTRMEKGMTRFLSVKAAALEPQTLETMLAFHVASATWLTQVATNRDMKTLDDICFPLSEEVPPLLYCVPEFIVENVADAVIFLKQFSSDTLEIPSSLDHLLTLIVVFMGNPERMKNPHLRASLAEMLEALMPPQDFGMFGSANREHIFKDHPLISELVPTLLHVFVSIEMTGQSVAFEQKFQYRRPMYVVLDYLWKIDKHKEKMKDLSIQAEKDIESVTPPLFLKFINLLMNDAIFLLDEALSSMSQLREQQQERSGWASLPAPQRHQRESNLQHMGLLARFYNVMGNETIHTLEWLTSEIRSIFCHPTIVDRIAAMLNYFLYNLVGPKKKNLKVKDFGEYEFKPQELVRDICRIYLHLGNGRSETHRAFCAAISRDGRSYSPELFVLAQSVLHKIAQSALATELDAVAQCIWEFATEYEKEEEALADAPDEFLDPIMNSIMVDPVTLPSSGINVDRATIARHLLSDQSDPFNRSPLTMDMVIPNTELKQRIQNWIVEHK